MLVEEALALTARELRVPAMVASAAQQVLRLASSHGYGRKDYSSDQAPV